MHDIIYEVAKVTQTKQHIENELKNFLKIVVDKNLTKMLGYRSSLEMSDMNLEN